VIVDAPESEAAVQARVALARIHLRNGDAARAAALAQEAVDRSAEVPRSVSELREGAMRAFLRGMGGGTWSARPPRTIPGAYRTASSLSLCPDGDLVVADERAGTVTRLDASGARKGAWTLPGVYAVTVDPYGRIFAADQERIVRLDESGVTAVGEQGKLAPVRSVAVDPEGRIFVLDRRGTRVGRLDPGATTLAPVFEVEGLELSGLAWDGARLVAADAKSAKLVEVLRTGGTRPIPGTLPKRVAAFATSPAGEIAILDDKTGDVLLLGPQGDARDKISARQLGIERPTAIALALDGSLRIVDEAKGSLTVVP
jgi:hypothetical protein